MDKQALQWAIKEAISAANKSMECARLAGIDDPRGNPYDVIISVLTEGISEAQFLKKHTCEYDSNSYCIHCGADGRA